MMKAGFALSAVVLAGLSVAACDAEAPGRAENRVMATDESGIGQTPPVNAAQDMAAGAVGAVDAAVTGGQTESFLRNAALGGLYEIRAGEIAVRKASSPELKAFGQTLIDDHRALNTRIEQAAADAGINFLPPTELDPRRQGMIDNLEAATDDFDRTFLGQQESAHQETLTLMEAYESRGDSAPLVAAVREATPMIRHHLELVRQHMDAETR